MVPPDRSPNYRFTAAIDEKSGKAILARTLLSGQNKTGATQVVAPVVLRLRTISVDEAGAGRLVQRGVQRAVFLAAGAGKLTDLVQVIRGPLAITPVAIPQRIIPS